MKIFLLELKLSSENQKLTPPARPLARRQTKSNNQIFFSQNWNVMAICRSTIRKLWRAVKSHFVQLFYLEEPTFHTVWKKLMTTACKNNGLLNISSAACFLTSFNYFVLLCIILDECKIVWIQIRCWNWPSLTKMSFDKTVTGPGDTTR